MSSGFILIILEVLPWLIKSVVNVFHAALVSVNVQLTPFLKAIPSTSSATPVLTAASAKALAR